MRARGEGLIAEMDAGEYGLAVTLSTLAERSVGDFRSSRAQSVSRNFIDEAGRISQRDINLADSPLARWLKPDPRTGLAWLSQVEFDAGERLRDDYSRSVLVERVTPDWEGYMAPVRTGRSRAKEDAPMSAMDARDRVIDALDAVGPGLDTMLSAVCLTETGLEAAERAANWPRRSGKAILKLALQRLAIHYGMVRACNLSPMPRFQNESAQSSN
ncbi:DUF6456 domain-containing protein [Hyphobacterium sp.]|uniref:DUF6456 domain-containing protein n=1 Tax=Hyphobacterium sp. TaxID=2004662 RepID=UPI00374A22BD